MTRHWRVCTPSENKMGTYYFSLNPRNADRPFDPLHVRHWQCQCHPHVLGIQCVLSLTCNCTPSKKKNMDDHERSLLSMYFILFFIILVMELTDSVSRRNLIPIWLSDFFFRDFCIYILLNIQIYVDTLSKLIFICISL